MKLLTRQSPIRILSLMTALLLGFCLQSSYAVCNTPLDPPETITLTLGQTFTNPGDTFEIPIFLNSENTEPSTIDIWIKYDPNKVEPFGEFYEFIIETSPGVPAVDDDGNTLTTRSIARPEAALDGLGKVIESEVHDTEGVIIIVIFGNTNAIPDGQILTLPFQTLPGALANDTIPIDGVASDESVEIFVESAGQNVAGQSSAAVTLPAGSKCFDVASTDGEVQMACTPVAETPTNVNASQGNADKVAITWNPVLTALAQYRVYRSETNNINNAIPIGSGWTTDTFFNDITASVPVELAAAGCTPQIAEVHYWYWVVARTPAGCEGNFSSPSAEGWRGEAAKKFNAREAGTSTLHFILVPLLMFLTSLFWKRGTPVRIRIQSE